MLGSRLTNFGMGYLMGGWANPGDVAVVLGQYGISSVLLASGTKQIETEIGVVELRVTL